MQLPDRLLKLALFGNAFFSLTSAAVFLIWPDSVSRFLGLEAPLLLQVVGAGLALFAMDLFHQATRSRMATWRALLASGGDFAWVAGSIILLVFFSGVLSNMGLVAVALVAAVVASFGWLQIIGILRVHRAANGRDFRHCIAVEAQAPAESMWRVIADLGDIAHYMPELKRSSLRVGQVPGIGTVRECEDMVGKRWAEECTAFDPEQRKLELRFLTEEPGFPFPAHQMRGGWQIIPLGASRCEVRVWWELDPKPRWLTAVLLPVLGWQVDQNFPKLISRMAAEASGGSNEVPQQTRHRLARLLPQPC